MAELSLELIGQQLQALQADLRQIKFSADVDRRLDAQRYDTLITTMGATLSTFAVRMEQRLNEIDAKMAERLDRIDERFTRLEQRLTANP